MAKKAASTARSSSSKPKKKSKTKETPPHSLPADDSIIGKPCPVCGQGIILKGRTAYGCSNWKNGCTFKLPFGKGIGQ